MLVDVERKQQFFFRLLDAFRDAEDSDTRIWLHVLRSRGTKKLVHSPDSDVFHIG